MHKWHCFIEIVAGMASTYDNSLLNRLKNTSAAFLLSFTQKPNTACERIPSGNSTFPDLTRRLCTDSTVTSLSGNLHKRLVYEYFMYSTLPPVDGRSQKHVVQSTYSVFESLRIPKAVPLVKLSSGLPASIKPTKFNKLFPSASRPL